jgi:integrase
MAGSIRKRTWTTRKGESKAAWQAAYFDQHSKRHARQFTTRRAADAWLTRTKGDVAAGIHTPDANSITVKEAAELWLTRRESKLLERGSLRTYRGYVTHILPRLGHVKLSRLTAPMVDAFADRLGDTLSWYRAGKVLSALKMILNAAQRRGLVGHNAALPVKMADDDRSERPVAVGVDVPTIGEARTIIDAATGRNRARLMTAAFTGLRASELRALTWNDLELERCVVSVSKRADWWGTIGRPKSKAAYREVPLIPRLVNALKEWQLACPPPPDGKPALVFPGRDGDPLNHGSLQLAFDEVQRAAGVVDATGKPKYSLHSLRHFFASWEIGQDAPPKRLQQLMGHSSIKMTYDVYGHWLADIEDDHARMAAGEAAVFGSAAARELTATQARHRGKR